MTGPIDLSNLPPEVRRKVEAGLAKLSPEARRQWEAKGSPMLARLVSGLAGLPVPPDPPPPRDQAPSAGPVIRRTPPHGHYNDTIAPGDRPGLVQQLLLGLAIVGFALWWLF